MRGDRVLLGAHDGAVELPDEGVGPLVLVLVLVLVHRRWCGRNDGTANVAAATITIAIAGSSKLSPTLRSICTANAGQTSHELQLSLQPTLLLLLLLLLPPRLLPPLLLLLIAALGTTASVLPCKLHLAHHLLLQPSIVPHDNTCAEGGRQLHLVHSAPRVGHREGGVLILHDHDGLRGTQIGTACKAPATATATATAAATATATAMLGLDLWTSS
jgi:hypothetical protein